MKRHNEYLIFSEKAEKKERKKIGTIVHRDVLKKERKESAASDTINKEEIYLLLLCYKTMYKRIKKLKYKWSKIKNKQKRDEIVIEIDECNVIMKQYYHDISFKYIDAANLLTRHPQFNGYSVHFKEDLVMDAYTRALNIGKEGNNNYGLPYFARFNFSEKVNVFSYWQQQCKNFFYQYIMEKYRYNNDMQMELHRIIDQFQYDAINIYGQNHAQFHLGTVTEDDDK